MTGEGGEEGQDTYQAGARRPRSVGRTPGGSGPWLAAGPGGCPAVPEGHDAVASAEDASALGAMGGTGDGWPLPFGVVVSQSNKKERLDDKV